MRRTVLSLLLLAGVALTGCSDTEPSRALIAPDSPVAARTADDVDAALRGYLTSHGFTGRIAST